MPDVEEAARLRLDEAEARAKVVAYEAQIAALERGMSVWRERVRTLEDSILKHHEATWPEPDPADMALYDQLGSELWT